jgi:O6-methylguanine-DNA--protein-cysteine methyltransferase
MIGYSWVDSPMGCLLGVVGSAGLRMLEFEEPRCGSLGEDWIEDAPALAGAARQLVAYFAGDLQTFDLPWPYTAACFSSASGSSYG